MRTFEQFVQEVKDSCEGHANRKGYTTNGVNEGNQLADVTKLLGVSVPHAVGEIVYKCAEFLRDPKPLLMVKVAGWAWMVWRGLPEPLDKSLK